MRNVSFVATLHALAVFAVGLAYALRGRSKRLHVALVCGYITGAEVLWRMTSAEIFWEFGKYAAAVLFLVSLLCSGRSKIPLRPVIYFALLLPSVALTLMSSDASILHKELSFNLSGPFTLMVSACFFSQLKITQSELDRLFLTIVSPIIGIAAISFYGIREASEIRFSDASNFVTSGGFGPNQVSAVLGLGALMALLFVFLGKSRVMIKVSMLGTAMFLAVASALTFSRGGLYDAMIAMLFAAIFIAKDSRIRNKFLLASLPVLIIACVLSISLDSFTEGALSTRFQNTSLTRRDEIARSELQAWRENPILGVGPGQARAYAGALAHTEFTRILAEHGTVGFIGLLFLLTGAWESLKKARTSESKAFAGAMIGWSLVFMLNAGMRVLAPSFALGIAFVSICIAERAHLPTDPNYALKRPLKKRGYQLGAKQYDLGPQAIRRATSSNQTV
jgi:O-antigen ligase